MKVETIESRAKKLIKEWSPRLGLENWDLLLKLLMQNHLPETLTCQTWLELVHHLGVAMPPLWTCLL